MRMNNSSPLPDIFPITNSCTLGMDVSSKMRFINPLETGNVIDAVAPEKCSISRSASFSFGFIIFVFCSYLYFSFSGFLFEPLLNVLEIELPTDDAASLIIPEDF